MYLTLVLRPASMSCLPFQYPRFASDLCLLAAEEIGGTMTHGESVQESGGSMKRVEIRYCSV
jgi:hypothetical protein